MITINRNSIINYSLEWQHKPDVPVLFGTDKVEDGFLGKVQKEVLKQKGSELFIALA